MKTFNTKDISTVAMHHLLLGAVAPRPIAFASTIDKDGNPNLSPFSFFNAFGANPATLVFSPSRRGRDNTTKHTFDNLKEVPEVVINVVTYDIVEQMSLSSTEYPRGTDEFIKSGLTPLPSEDIRPFRVKESPVHFECTVREIIETGDMGGAGNLVICDVLKVHVKNDIMDENNKIDPLKIDLVGRLGGDYYCRAWGNAVFKVKKPLATLGIGIDQLPEKIKFSDQLTGNDLGKLGNIEALPNDEKVKDYSKSINLSLDDKEVAIEARRFLANDKVEEALLLLMAAF